jgi:hypothetical protein
MQYKVVSNTNLEIGGDRFVGILSALAQARFTSLDDTLFLPG